MDHSKTESKKKLFVILSLSQRVSQAAALFIFIFRHDLNYLPSQKKFFLSEKRREGARGDREGEAAAERSSGEFVVWLLIEEREIDKKERRDFLKTTSKL